MGTISMKQKRLVNVISFKNLECMSNCAKCDGEKICTKCSEGYYIQDSTTNPTLSAIENKCIADCGEKYYGDLKTGKCAECPGSYCLQCNQESPSECLKCDKGTYVNNLACSECTPGTYQPDAGEDSCKNCSPGTYTNLNKQTECKSCSEGSYTDKDGQANCLLCDIGSYIGTEGQSSCISCEVGKYTENKGSTSSTDCKDCHPFCASCTGSSKTQCLKCNSAIPHLIIKENVCSCEIGYYEDTSASNNPCKPCGSFCADCDATECFNCVNNNGVVLKNGVCTCSAPGYFIYYNEETKEDDCSTCHKFCDKCFGPLNTECISCNEALGVSYISSYTCGCSKENYFDELDQSCQPCNPLCDGCKGPTNKECISCNFILSFNVKDKPDWCVVDCPALGQYYLDKSTCTRIFIFYFSL